ncbi:MAG: hypothetical protein JNM39_09765 [Bdellovibrionaceae bacterium]|nr:hypothetical protein [Pseudobdellovibrionaceae bacterium]
MSFRFTEDGLAKLRALADDDLRSMASMLEIIIKEAYENKFQKDEKA